MNEQAIRVICALSTLCLGLTLLLLSKDKKQ